MPEKDLKSKLFPDINSKTYVMGILNLTPDSFSGDGLAKNDNLVESALMQAKRFVEDGADLLDLGAESTRPGYTPISSEEEIDRLLPVIQALRQELPDIILSVDCYRAQTAEAVLNEGVQIINDIWGFKYDPKMPDLVANHGATAILMHNRRAEHATSHGHHGGYVKKVHYDNLLEDIKNDIKESIKLAKQAGLADDQIIIDPGIGFAKSREQNIYLLRHLETLTDLGYPILLGVSRKGFIGYTLNLPADQRLEGSLASNAWGLLHGANILRVHDVKETVRLAHMLDTIRFASLS